MPQVFVELRRVHISIKCCAFLAEKYHTNMDISICKHAASRAESGRVARENLLCCADGVGLLLALLMLVLSSALVSHV